MPELAKAIGPHGSGIYKEEVPLEPPIIFLEGNAWPEDKFDLTGALEFSVYVAISNLLFYTDVLTCASEREICGPPSRGGNVAGISVDFDDGSGVADMVLHDERETSPESTRSEIADGENTGGYTVCHPSSLLKKVATQSTPANELPQLPPSHTPHSPSPAGPTYQPPSMSKSTTPPAVSLRGKFALPPSDATASASTQFRQATAQVPDNHPFYQFQNISVGLAISSDSSSFTLHPARWDLNGPGTYNREMEKEGDELHQIKPTPPAPGKSYSPGWMCWRYSSFPD